MTGANPSRTPPSASEKLDKYENEEASNHKEYRATVGFVLHLTVMTPDILYFTVCIFVQDFHQTLRNYICEENS